MPQVVERWSKKNAWFQRVSAAVLKMEKCKPRCRIGVPILRFVNLLDRDLVAGPLSIILSVLSLVLLAQLAVMSPVALGSNESSASSSKAADQRVQVELGVGYHAETVSQPSRGSEIERNGEFGSIELTAEGPTKNWRFGSDFSNRRRGDERFQSGGADIHFVFGRGKLSLRPFVELRREADILDEKNTIIDVTDYVSSGLDFKLLGAASQLVLKTQYTDERSGARDPFSNADSLQFSSRIEQSWIKTSGRPLFQRIIHRQARLIDDANTANPSSSIVSASRRIYRALTLDLATGSSPSFLWGGSVSQLVADEPEQESRKFVSGGLFLRYVTLAGTMIESQIFAHEQKLIVERSMSSKIGLDLEYSRGMLVNRNIELSKGQQFVASIRLSKILARESVKFSGRWASYHQAESSGESTSVSGQFSFKYPLFNQLQIELANQVAKLMQTGEQTQNQSLWRAGLTYKF